MTALALVGLFVLAGTSLIYSIYSIVRLSGEQRASIIYSGGLAIRYTYWVGMDAAKLQHALGIAISCLSRVWPVAMISVALDGVHFDITGDNWTDTAERGRIVPQPSRQQRLHSRIALVDVNFKFLAHELAHLVDGYSGGGRRDAHYRWNERGVFAALSEYERALQQLEVR